MSDSSHPWRVEKTYPTYDVVGIDFVKFAKYQGVSFDASGPIYSEFFIKDGQVLHVCNAYIDGTVERFVPQKSSN